MSDAVQRYETRRNEERATKKQRIDVEGLTEEQQATVAMANCIAKVGC